MATTNIAVERGSDTPVLTFGIIGCSNGRVYITSPTTDYAGYIKLIDSARNLLTALLQSGTLHPTARTNRVHGLD